MGYLIEVDTKKLESGVAFPVAIDALRAAWTSVAEMYVEAFSVRGGPLKPSSLLDIRRSLPRVPLRAPSGAPSARLVWPASTGDWELSEVHRQLCQVGAMIEALQLVEQYHLHGTVKSLSPTQQSGLDATGADGNGGIWALEVFGGIAVTNNDKARKDAKVLCDKAGLSHRYFACFDDAWQGYKSKTYLFHDLVSGGTPKVRLMTVERPPGK